MSPQINPVSLSGLIAPSFFLYIQTFWRVRLLLASCRNGFSRPVCPFPRICGRKTGSGQTKTVLPGPGWRGCDPGQRQHFLGPAESSLGRGVSGFKLSSILARASVCLCVRVCVLVRVQTPVVTCVTSELRSSLVQRRESTDDPSRASHTCGQGAWVGLVRVGHR